jgi:hypothetical protein
MTIAMQAVSSPVLAPSPTPVFAATGIPASGSARNSTSVSENVVTPGKEVVSEAAKDQTSVAMEKGQSVDSVPSETVASTERDATIEAVGSSLQEISDESRPSDDVSGMPEGTVEPDSTTAADNNEPADVQQAPVPTVPSSVVVEPSEAEPLEPVTAEIVSEPPAEVVVEPVPDSIVGVAAESSAEVSTEVPPTEMPTEVATEVSTEAPQEDGADDDNNDTTDNGDGKTVNDGANKKKKKNKKKK